MQEFVSHDGEFHIDEIDQGVWRWLTERMSYVQGDLNDPATYARLSEHLAGLDKTAGTAGNYLFLSRRRRPLLRAGGCRTWRRRPRDERDGQWRRVVIEKPFGHDLRSAKALNAEILQNA